MSGKQRQAGEEKDFLCYHWNNLLTHWLLQPRGAGGWGRTDSFPDAREAEH